MDFMSIVGPDKNLPRLAILRVDVRWRKQRRWCNDRVKADLRQNGTTGKSILIFRNRVKPQNRKESKINRWPRRATQMFNDARLPR